MKPLERYVVAAVRDMADRPLCRLLATLGAEIRRIEVPDARCIGQSDLLIDNLGIEGLADAAVTRDQLEAWNPGLVHVSVTPFGSGGERARFKGGELVASAMGGTLRLTGQPDRPPVKEALDACTFHAEMVAASGAVAALFSRQTSGRGQHVDVSIQEVAFSRNVNGVLVWQFDRRKLHRVGGALNYGKATVRCIWKLADGWCFHSLMTGRFGAPANQALSDWIDETGLRNPLRGVDWLSYNRSTLDPTTRVEWEQTIADFFLSRTRAEIRVEGRRRGINACVVEEPGDVLADPHLRAREFWRTENGFEVPSRFVRFTRAAASGGESKPRASSRQRGGPLSGVRVVDFSWALVGSISTKILGDLGADIVKVESRSRPCLSRIDVQVAASRHDNLDDKPWFAHLNTSKRSLALDLKRPESREILEPLIAWADAVVENFSPGTMDKLGLGYSELAAMHPGIVMASGSVYGQTGPLYKEWGVDGTGAALSGRTFLTGWPDRDPVVPGAVPYGDVIVPYVIATCVVAGLLHRMGNGHGCHVDAAMYEICVQQMRSAIIAAQQGQAPARTGNSDARVALQDVYPARGDDRWIAISAFDETDLKKLRDLAGNRPIEDWTREQDDFALMALLQSEGIAAGVVQDIEDLMEADPELMARGALVDLPHSRLGSFGHVRTPIVFSLDNIAPYRAPALGEHTREIVEALAGITPERRAQLEEAGVLK